MKKIISLTVFSVTVLMLTGCYTQLAVSEHNDDELDIVIYYPIPVPPSPPPPGPGPCPKPEPPDSPHPNYPPPPKEKIRNPEPPPSSGNGGVREKIRDGGGRNNSGKRNKR